MIKPGHIRITDKVYFEYYKLEEPDGYVADGYTLPNYKWEEQMKAYEASKQLIEVSNETYPVMVTNNAYWILLHKSWIIIINGKSCKAEVNGKTVIIMELI